MPSPVRGHQRTSAHQPDAAPDQVRTTAGYQRPLTRTWAGSGSVLTVHDGATDEHLAPEECRCLRKQTRTAKVGRRQCWRAGPGHPVARGRAARMPRLRRPRSDPIRAGEMAVDTSYRMTHGREATHLSRACRLSGRCRARDGLPSLRALVLPPLPTRRSPGSGRPRHDQPQRLPMRTCHVTSLSADWPDGGSGARCLRHMSAFVGRPSGAARSSQPTSRCV